MTFLPLMKLAPSTAPLVSVKYMRKVTCPWVPATSA